MDDPRDLKNIFFALLLVAALAVIAGAGLKDCDDLERGNDETVESASEE